MAPGPHWYEPARHRVIAAADWCSDVLEDMFAEVEVWGISQRPTVQTIRQLTLPRVTEARNVVLGAINVVRSVEKWVYPSCHELLDEDSI